MSLNKQIEQAIEKELKQGYEEIEEDNMMSVDVSLLVTQIQLCNAYWSNKNIIKSFTSMCMTKLERL